MKNILYNVAKDINGELIKAALADKDNSFFCSICNTELLLRTSGNTGNKTLEK